MKITFKHKLNLLYIQYNIVLLHDWLMFVIHGIDLLYDIIIILLMIMQIYIKIVSMTRCFY